MKRLTSNQFRTAFATLNHDVEVTAYGRVVGTWRPSDWQVARLAMFGDPAAPGRSAATSGDEAVGGMTPPPDANGAEASPPPGPDVGSARTVAAAVPAPPEPDEGPARFLPGAPVAVRPRASAPPTVKGAARPASGGKARIATGAHARASRVHPAEPTGVATHAPGGEGPAARDTNGIDDIRARNRRQAAWLQKANPQKPPRQR